MKEQLKIALWFTLLTTAIFGLAYPLAVTGLAQLIFPRQAGGSLLGAQSNAGSALIGQPFSSPVYFHPRPSAAGNGYDPMSSGGSNLAATNHQLTDRVQADLAKLQAENPGVPVPADLVTASASGLDPDISPASAQFQIPRVAAARGISAAELRQFVDAHTTPRQFGFLGEPRVNVLLLNRDLDAAFPRK
ncbi:MAG TPA: potassium-transporting ATPase subunit KdpC [Dongiaceae bacterium]|nr:potassium-transporting ATPase subunit KdpC [Dongiaceae bacterium]